MSTMYKIWTSTPPRFTPKSAQNTAFGSLLFNKYDKNSLKAKHMTEMTYVWY